MNEEDDLFSPSIERQLVDACRFGNLKKAKRLVAEGADIHYKADMALRLGAGYGQLEVVKYLVSLGANIHADSDYALRTAELAGYDEVVGFLKRCSRKEKLEKILG
jgi:hypothetical protein